MGKGVENIKKMLATAKFTEEELVFSIGYLLGRHDRLEQGLIFYATKSNYEKQIIEDDPRLPTCFVDTDKGEVARKMLKEDE